MSEKRYNLTEWEIKELIDKSKDYQVSEVKTSRDIDYTILIIVGIAAIGMLYFGSTIQTSKERMHTISALRDVGIYGGSASEHSKSLKSYYEKQADIYKSELEAESDSFFKTYDGGTLAGGEAW